MNFVPDFVNITMDFNMTDMNGTWTEDNTNSSYDTADNVTTSLEAGNNTFGNSGGSPLIGYTVSVIYSLVCLFGLVGNGLVIYAVLKFEAMKTVTNIFILNLAITDVAFLLGMPFAITTILSRTWVFGAVMCNIYYIITTINQYCSVFTLVIMSIDRYLAVCHPIRSKELRTIIRARLTCFFVWVLSTIVILPIIIYSRMIVSKGNHNSCIVEIPKYLENGLALFAFIIGFVIPVWIICILYALLVIRVRNLGVTTKTKTDKMKKTHRKVTKMVLTVILVYIICWMPYNILQIILQLGKLENRKGRIALLICQVLAYTNSMLNPILYAFMSDNFRTSFIKFFKMNQRAFGNQKTHIGKTEQSVLGDQLNENSRMLYKMKEKEIEDEEKMNNGEKNAVGTIKVSYGMQGNDMTVEFQTKRQ